MEGGEPVPTPSPARLLTHHPLAAAEAKKTARMSDGVSAIMACHPDAL